MFREVDHDGAGRSVKAFCGSPGALVTRPRPSQSSRASLAPASQAHDQMLGPFDVPRRHVMFREVDHQTRRRAEGSTLDSPGRVPFRSGPAYPASPRPPACCPQEHPKGHHRHLPAHRLGCPQEHPKGHHRHLPAHRLAATGTPEGTPPAPATHRLGCPQEHPKGHHRHLPATRGPATTTPPPARSATYPPGGTPPLLAPPRALARSRRRPNRGSLTSMIGRSPPSPTSSSWTGKIRGGGAVVCVCQRRPNRYMTGSVASSGPMTATGRSSHQVTVGSCPPPGCRRSTTRRPGTAPCRWCGTGTAAGRTW